MKCSLLFIGLFLTAACPVACFSDEPGSTSKLAFPRSPDEPLADSDAEADQSSESAADAAARDDVMASELWQSAEARFAQWLTIQKVYGPGEIEALKSDLRNRVAQMSAEQLESFAQSMHDRLDILLDPAAVEARRWVDLFTETKQQEIVEQYGMTDPMRTSPAEIAAALQQFQADRQRRRAASSAFESARASQVAGVQSHQKAVAEARRNAGRSRNKPSDYYSSHYAPRRKDRQPQTYQAPYRPTQYSVGPWGGVWLNINR